MSKRTFSYGYYLVAYLDLLGQQRKLSTLKRLPGTAEEMHETQRTLADTAGAVLRFRELLDGFMQRFRTPGPLLHTLPQPAQDQLLLARQSVKYHGFSDTLVMTVRLRTGDEHCTQMNGVFGAISACCMLQLTMLAMKLPVRGGIEVSLGLDITDDEVYGPALSEAYRMESEAAEYPRVLVGKQLWEYLTVVESQVAMTPLGRIATLLATQTKRFITADQDGQHILDFLGSEMAGRVGETRHELAKAIDTFVTDQQRVFQADQTLGPRYERLREYVTARLPLWQ